MIGFRNVLGVSSVSALLLMFFSGCAKSEESRDIQVTRFLTNPLITLESSPTLGNKINGPCVVRVPDWIPNPLGKYYLYFAHHKGDFIRLAYADNLEGPWRIHEPGTIHLQDARVLEDHIASPDVHIDNDNKIIRMYLHGSHPGTNQRTVSAVSRDGLSFDVSDEILGYSYFRVFRYGGAYYAIDALGFLNRSEHPDHGWERREPELIPPVTIEDTFGKRDDVRIRHAAVYVREDVLYLFYTRKSDAPERIVMAEVSLAGDWKTWEAGEPIEVLRPEMEYEGIGYLNEPSKKGGGIERQELRDPYVFEDGGQLYLFYSVAGEEGIAGARLEIH